jgi:hypothetical protein
MKAYRLLVAVSLVVLPSLVFAQDKKEVDLADILDDWVTTKDSILRVEDVMIVRDKIWAYTEGLPDESKNDRGSVIWTYLDNKHKDKIEYDEFGRIRIDKGLEFRGVEMEDLYLKDISFPSLYIGSSKFKIVELDSMEVESFTLLDTDVETKVKIEYGSINNDLEMYRVNTPSLEIQRSAIPNRAAVWGSIGEVEFSYNWANSLNDRLTWDRTYANYWMGIQPVISGIDSTENIADVRHSSQDYQIEIFTSETTKTNVLTNILPNYWFAIHSQTTDLAIDNNILSVLYIGGLLKSEQISISENLLLSGFMLDKYLQEIAFEIDWKDIRQKLVRGTDTLYSHSTEEVASNFYYFERMSKAYSSLHTYYKSIGLLDYANECYIEWKDMQTARMRYIYQTEGGFENFYKWQLNNLLKFYASYGTSPAKSIVISTYIILIFAIFYFFFPSEWDTTSKTRLISDFKDFTQKNDKGYIKPFFIMLIGFAISLINALTLSLNSFVTLGFGTIPTKGLARYVCIVQGFIGWFLLSIFTVALISQVLG